MLGLQHTIRHVPQSSEGGGLSESAHLEHGGDALAEMLRFET
jgi:hypothetical protein